MGCSIVQTQECRKVLHGNDIFFLSYPFPILRGRHLCGLFEDAAEVCDVVVSAFAGDIADIEVLLGIEQPFGIVHTKLCDVCGGVVPCDAVDSPIELYGADSQTVGKLGCVEFVLPNECKDVVVEFVDELLVLGRHCFRFLGRMRIDGRIRQGSIGCLLFGCSMM